MNDKCGMRSLQFVWELYALEGLAEHDPPLIEELRKHVWKQLIENYSCHAFALYDKKYHLIYCPLQGCAELQEILEKVSRKKMAADTFCLKVSRTTVIARRKYQGKRQDNLGCIYDYRRFFVDETDFLPSCVALRIAGYVLKEVYF